MPLRILVWNCNMRLHDKVDRLRSLRPDIAVLPECACPEVLLRRAEGLDASDFAWEGVNPHKGLAVLAFGGWRLAVDRRHRPWVGTTLPVLVSGLQSFRLLAVWGIPPWGHRPRRRSPEPLLSALERLDPFLEQRPAIVAGDFNATLVRRTRDGVPRASALARHLEERGFSSAYHRLRDIDFGQESDPTYFHRRRLASRHHIDHVFVDRETSEWIRSAEVGFGPRWITSSDHAPVVVEIDCPAS